jgi:hypothetical protein
VRIGESDVPGLIRLEPFVMTSAEPKCLTTYRLHFPSNLLCGQQRLATRAAGFEKRDEPGQGVHSGRHPTCSGNCSNPLSLPTVPERYRENARRMAQLNFNQH